MHVHMAYKRERTPTTCGVPDPEGTVVASADNSLSVGAKGHTVDITLMFAERAHLLSLGHVPDYQSLVATGADKTLPVGAKGHRR